MAAAALIMAAASAATAEAATLSVAVSPATVHQNETYAITIAGRYNKRSLHTTPRLLAFIEYTGNACRSSAMAEYALPTSKWSWVFYPQRAERSSPFSVVIYERARTRFGARRVCAYLYARKVTPTSTDKPLAVASAGYRDVKG
ncbi:MAG TPA: hypothetical protein VGI50_14360 [Solirubrobacteraceae bacterium]